MKLPVESDQKGKLTSVITKKPVIIGLVLVVLTIVIIALCG